MPSSALVAEYEKQSGNKIDSSIIPFAPMRQKIISAITSGVVPDLIYADAAGGRARAGLGRPAASM